jgi:hypothetical protein
MKSKPDDNQKLKLLLGELHPIQVFKKYFLEGLTPDPVEMKIDPPTQLFNEIIEGKKITFAVGLHLDRYYPGALRLVEYQKLYDGQMDRIWEAHRSGQFKARERERAARERKLALVRRQHRQLCAELRRRLRAKGDR